MSDCRKFRAGLQQLLSRGGELDFQMRKHLSACPDCLAVAAATSMGTLAGEAGCPDGFDLACLVGGGAVSGDPLSVAVHGAVCPECRDTVGVMRQLKERSVAAPAVGAEKGTLETRVVDWLDAAGEIRTGVLKWLRTVVRDQFWIPALEPVGAIQGLAGAHEESNWGEQYRGKLLEVLDPFGASLPDVTGMVVVPLTVDRAGMMSSTVDVSSQTVRLEGEISLFLDLHGRGVLKIGPSDVDRRSDRHLVAVFEASGFDRVPLLVPLEEYCIVFDLS